MSREQASADLSKWLIEDAEAMNDTSEQPVYEYQIISPRGSASGPCSLNLARRMVREHPGTIIERRQVGPWEKVEQ